VLDGIPNDGIEELTQSANAGLIRVVIGMDSEAYRRASTIGGRVQQSLLGASAVPLELFSLSNKEFRYALESLDKAFGATFFNGAQHVVELRWPRVLRVIAAMLPKGFVPDKSPDGHESRMMIQPIPGPMILEACSRIFVQAPILRFDLQKVAAAFLEDAAQNIANPDWLGATWGRPSVEPSLLKSTLGEQRVQELCDYGFLSWIDTQRLGPRLLIRIAELLLHHVAEEWSNNLANLHSRDIFGAEIRRLLDLSVAIPSGELAVAAAIIRAMNKNEIILTDAIEYLIKQKPTTSRLKEGARIDLLMTEGPIRLLFGEGMDEEVVDNIQAWVVLSHLASFPMGHQKLEKTANFYIFLELGSSRHFIYRAQPTELSRVARLHFHEIDGIGSIPCLRTGIVEPLLQAMLAHAHRFPDELVSLAELAMQGRKVHLAWRLLTVGITSKTSTDKHVQRAAEGVEKVLKEWWGKALEESLHSPK
jgi:hypothetical protein